MLCQYAVRSKCMQYVRSSTMMSKSEHVVCSGQYLECPITHKSLFYEQRFK